MNRYLRLVNDSAIFAIGNLGSKLINILLVPLYTFYLTTTEYGTVDVITTTISMLLPIITLSIFDAVLRFAMDKSKDSSSVFTNGLAVTLIGSIVSLVILTPLLNLFHVKYFVYLMIILVLQAFQTMEAEYARAIGKVKIFALNGIIGTIITAISNVVMIVFFRMGMNGYLLSMVFAMLACCVFLTISLNAWQYLKIDTLSWKAASGMLMYSIPLIPNALSWWISNASSRYFILFFVGVSANGLYAVANKIPSLLSMLNSIFFQAWQLSAIDEYSSEDNDKFYSSIFSHYFGIMFLAASFILLVIKPVLKYFVGHSFFESWTIIPILIFSVMYSCFAGFFGTNYIAAKKTVGIMMTTFYGAIINIITSFMFVPHFGAIGAAVSSLISFSSVFFLRIKDTRKFIDIYVDYKKFFFHNLVFIIQICILYLVKNVLWAELSMLAVFIYFLLMNKLILRLFYKLICRVIKKGDKD